MPLKKIITQQNISASMCESARRLRQEMTETEKILWQNLRANRLGGFHFRRQQIIGQHIVDFYCHAASLVIEVDGEIHLRQVEKDLERDVELNGIGLLVLRFKNKEIENNLANVLKQIQNVCVERVK